LQAWQQRFKRAQGSAGECLQHIIAVHRVLMTLSIATRLLLKRPQAEEAVVLLPYALSSVKLDGFKTFIKLLHVVY
jgi:hypothetical protein